MPREDLIQYRRDSAANWATANPVLEDGETGFDKTNNQIRIGDGVSAWLDLPALASDVSDVVNTGRLSESELSATFAHLEGGVLVIDGEPVGGGDGGLTVYTTEAELDAVTEAEYGIATIDTEVNWPTLWALTGKANLPVDTAFFEDGSEKYPAQVVNGSIKREGFADGADPVDWFPWGRIVQAGPDSDGNDYDFFTLRKSGGYSYGAWAKGLRVVTVPLSATASGAAGQVAYDANYFYICTATNTWKRVAIAAW